MSNLRYLQYSFFFKECPPGFLGDNCSKMCEYPTFGKRCAEQCLCIKYQCNFTFGCTKCKYCLPFFKFAILIQKKKIIWFCDYDGLCTFFFFLLKFTMKKNMSSQYTKFKLVIYLSQIMSKPSPLLPSRVNNQKVKQHNSYSLRLLLFVFTGDTAILQSLSLHVCLFQSVCKIIYLDLITRLFIYMI